MVGYGNGNSREEFWPLDVMINILKRVPVKSLIRFKCVAKDWGELFKTPYFIAQHLHHSASNNSYLLLQRIPEPYHQSHPFTFSTCLIGPDLKIHNPQFIDFTSPTAKIVGSCNGLWCVRHTDHAKLSLWNPATRQVRQEVFTLIKGPPPPPSPTHSYSDTIAVYNNKLTMFRHFVMGNFESSSIDLWVLENTHTCATGESWIKNYSVGPFSRILYPLSIWRDEILCRVELPRHVDEYNGVGTVLSLFNPSSNELKKLPTHKHEFYYLSFNYAESLVPVDNIHYEQ
ncbi:uncharacterized protein LOC133296596 isoform X2 [Gastrolobium bilobum]|uniref:uncharacterized protein LOC133296596 isoform X2 n=1 Tax=Gastrolobium bilobum TaxID=150636 RepID=UPI002AAF654A|nr:uncharacterized protein LOC133296596 isoform X2 [Gastrolobium bilobum]